jgi:hypothetical protein
MLNIHYLEILEVNDGPEMLLIMAGMMEMKDISEIEPRNLFHGHDLVHSFLPLNG